MSKHANMDLGGHDWGKINLVTVTKRRGSYDEYKCKGCGLKGKRHSLSSSLQVDGRASQQKIIQCPASEAPTIEEGKEFKILTSPWVRVPVGTIILLCDRNEKEELQADGNWYKMKDGSNPFIEFEPEHDGKFKLYDTEVSEV